MPSLLMQLRPCAVTCFCAVRRAPATNSPCITLFPAPLTQLHNARNEPRLDPARLLVNGTCRGVVCVRQGARPHGESQHEEPRGRGEGVVRMCQGGAEGPCVEGEQCGTLVEGSLSCWLSNMGREGD
eukprot:jgi/Mesvir1/7515/Mv19271-RA.1